MTDIIDHATERTAELLGYQEALIRYKAAHIPQGTEGDCDHCGEWSSRLVDGACAPCRDRYHLP